MSTVTFNPAGEMSVTCQVQQTLKQYPQVVLSSGMIFDPPPTPRPL